MTMPLKSSKRSELLKEKLLQIMWNTLKVEEGYIDDDITSCDDLDEEIAAVIANDSCDSSDDSSENDNTQFSVWRSIHT